MLTIIFSIFFVKKTFIDLLRNVMFCKKLKFSHFRENFRFFRIFSFEYFCENEKKFSRKCKNKNFCFNPSISCSQMQTKKVSLFIYLLTDFFSLNVSPQSAHSYLCGSSSLTCFRLMCSQSPEWLWNTWPHQEQLRDRWDLLVQMVGLNMIK
jgi:hypothetical protein